MGENDDQNPGNDISTSKMMHAIYQQWITITSVESFVFTRVNANILSSDAVGLKFFGRTNERE